ncbi:Bug family tripartite tricarboxylate transporter substrate binding protein [Reyranella soli]|uniref:MFS transporter n=1 Tax=Reyranella soli TaxID=1230389 RepID=A0A512NMV6_9HYPH|nr:tripartite tricarboxylate transporter substrate binding protein [Reyranella soli]GEP60275.1 MFS transporter [Reyranella soli]
MRVLTAAAALLAGLLSCTAVQAQTYPNKTVKIIVPYQAGQGTDVATRYFADQLTKALGQTFYVDNKPGAGGNIGTEAAAHSPADGYTLLMGTNGTQTMNEFLYAAPGFDPGKDFTPIMLVGLLPMVVAANPSFPANSVAELVAAAKAKPDKIDVALPSTTARLVFELLKERTGAPLFGVPYKGSATAITEVMGGQVQTMVDTVTALRGHVTSGKLKALGITTLKPSELLAGVKPVAEQGVPGFETTGWVALYAPRGTPEPIIAALSKELTRILIEPETRQRLLQIGLDPVGGTPASLAEFEKRERAKWGPVIKAAGLKGE